MNVYKSTIMKKRFYILLIFVVSIGFVGCNKIDLNPHDCEEDRSMENFEKGLDDDGGDNFGRDDDSDESITDPNHDEDEDQKRRR